VSFLFQQDIGDIGTILLRLEGRATSWTRVPVHPYEGKRAKGGRPVLAVFYYDDEEEEGATVTTVGRWFQRVTGSI
jgi:hypothetical protein